jgi:hypothetical protein
MTPIDPPVLDAEPDPRGTGWRVWCRHCHCYHRHGALEGHRVAHCRRDTPYRETGYVLRLHPDHHPERTTP